MPHVTMFSLNLHLGRPSVVCYLSVCPLLETLRILVEEYIASIGSLEHVFFFMEHLDRFFCVLKKKF